MSAPQVIQVPARLLGVVMLARLLQRLEASREPVDPEQYRTVVRRLEQALQDTPADEALKSLFKVYPAAGEVYENLHYDHAGLCEAPLEAALNAELQARDVLARLSRP